jgi:hypothetical protein
LNVSCQRGKLPNIHPLLGWQSDHLPHFQSWPHFGPSLGCPASQKQHCRQERTRKKFNDPPSYNHSLEQVISEVLMGEINFLIRTILDSFFKKNHSPVLMAV